MSYEHYDVEGFATDVAFIRWVKAPDATSEQFWTEFIQAHPQQAAAVRTARRIVSAIHFQSFEPSVVQVEAMRGNIRAQLADSRPLTIAEAPARWRLPPVYRNWLMAASLVGTVLALTWLWMGSNQQTQAIATNYGEIKKVTLPDGTVVSLNGNSNLRVARHIERAAIREVWIEGEALFQVAKRNQATFVVHTDQQLDIEVLGTTFNVDARQENISVVLQEGKVQLATPDMQKKVVMQPGDLAVYNPKAHAVQLKSADPYAASSWTEGVIVLNNMTVQMIVDYLKDTYNVVLTTNESDLLEEQLVGKMSIANLDEFIENIALSLDLKAEKTAANQYLLKRN
jgi:transmembrane sensor